jgi:hypothetical protein
MEFWCNKVKGAFDGAVIEARIVEENCETEKWEGKVEGKTKGNLGVSWEKQWELWKNSTGTDK